MACCKFSIVLFFLFISSYLSNAATITSKATGGAWASGATWVGDVAPAATDDVIIATTGGNAVTIGAAAVCTGLTINADAILTATTFGLTVNGPWLNNGTYNHGTTSTVTFGGLTAAIEPGLGTANFRNISIASGAALIINTPTTTAGTFAFATPAASTNSTVTISGTNTLDVSGAMTIARPPTNTFECKFDVGAGTLTVGGTFTMSATTGTRYSVLAVSTGTVNLNAVTTGTTGCLINFTDVGTINIAGTVGISSPTVSPSTGTINYTGLVNQGVWSSAYYNLHLLENNIKSLNSGTATINNVLTIDAGTTLNINSRILAFAASGTYLVNNGTLDASTGTINYTGADAQDILDISYTNLGFSGAGAKTITDGSTLTITGNWVCSSPTTLSTSTSVVMGGNLTGTGAMVMNTGTITIGGNWTHSGTFTAGTGRIHYNGAAQTVRGMTYYNLELSNAGIKTLSTTTLVGNVLTINNCTLNYNSRTITLSGAGTPLVNNGGDISGTSGTFSFTTNAQNVPGLSYRNLTFAGAAKTIADGETLTVALNWSVGAPTNMIATASAVVNGLISGSGAITMDTGTITADSSWTNSGVTVPGTSTVYFTNDHAQTLRGNFYSVEFSGAGTKTLSTTTTVNNTMTIGLGTTLSIGTSTLNFPATGTPLVNNGTLTGTTGVIAFTGSGTQNVPGLTYRNLTFTGIGEKIISDSPVIVGNLTNSSPMTISTDALVSITGNWVNNNTAELLTTGSLTLTGSISGAGAISMGSGTITVATNWTNTGGLTPGTGTVEYNGAVAQTVRGTNYHNLIFSGPGTKTIATGTTITLGSNWTTDSPVTMSGSAGANIAGDIAGSGSITMGSGIITLEGNWTNNGTLTPGTGMVHYDGGTQSVGAQDYYRLQISEIGVKTLAGNTGVSNLLTINTPGTLNLGSFDLTISGSGTPVLATGTLQPVTSTVKYTNAAATTIAALDYYSLDGSGGTRTLASSGTIGIAGTFTPGAGAYTITGSTIHFNGSGVQTIPAFNYQNLNATGGNRILDPVGTIGIAGDFTPGAGSFTIITSTVNFNGLTSQTLPEFTFNDLILSETGVKTLLTGTTLTANTITIQDGAVLDIEGTSVLTIIN
ncbi:hypothetical protein [Daejeonella sp.]|uniref:beta strand repeat-containing protein n=1 Tax=Daejeonella sp. TaxID=2805397 RepID=UPI002733FB53|nr:hypothetical protein [Daejeonella sp.]